MAYVDLAEFKSVLQVGSIYPDSELQSAIDSAENVLNEYLTFDRYSVIAHKRKDAIGTIYTDKKHGLYIGQSVIVSLVGGSGSTFNGTKTVTAVTDTSITYTASGADLPENPVVPHGWVSAGALNDYSTTPEVKAAAMAIAVDVWLQRQGSVGQQGVDFQPAPYKLGRAMIQRVIGLLGRHIDINTMVG